MLDPVTVKLLEKLKTMAKKRNVEVDLQRMEADMGYANQMLTELGNTLDPEQGLVVLQLMQQLCLIDMSDGMGE